MHILLAIFIFAQHILLGATFTSSTTAAITWQQPPDPPGLTHTCLLREYGGTWPTGICFDDLPAGPQRVDLPGALSHPAYRPAYGDRYLLQINGVTVGQAILGEAEVHTLYVPLLTKQNAPAVKVERVYLAVIRGG